MISDSLNLLEFVSKFLEERSTLKALFNWEGTRLEGTEKIVVNKWNIPTKENQWYYRIQAVDKYVFVPYPTNPSVYIDFGKYKEDNNPSADLFRFVSNPMSNFASGGLGNLKVDFLVFGYIPSDLLKIPKAMR